MRKLNLKNKFYIGIFAIIILLIVGILVCSLFLSQKNGKVVYNVSNNCVIFDSETNLIDTSLGGEVTRKWGNNYYYVNQDKYSYEIGNTPVIYEKTNNEIQIFGDNYQVYSDGSVLKNNDLTVISNSKDSSFFKLSDRVYLILSPEIYNDDKSIYTSIYLIVYIDKKGNASILNDSINLKTINPMNLLFDDYTFDIANEKLIIKDNVIDLKQIIGSTNEYEEKPKGSDVIFNVDMKDFVTKYNNLVNSFQQYTGSNFPVGSNQNISNNNFVINGNYNNQGNKVNNSVNITKKVSLRGSISYPSYIDVTYLVSDIEDKYQAVYLLVTGVINDEEVTEKIILDKYASTYRINNLSPKHEYSISLGYVERVKGADGNFVAQDVIEDVINVRTTKSDVLLNIEKISKGYVYFNVKMSQNYALETATVTLYSDDYPSESVEVNVVEALTNNGFSSKLKLVDGSLIELVLENATYSGKTVDLNVRKKFVY